MSMKTDLLYLNEDGTEWCTSQDFTPPDSLKVAAKRYFQPEPEHANAQGLTLLFAHCIGTHKEHWEPVIERLFATRNQINSPQHRIREAWAFDWQSHGDSAVANEVLLRDMPEGVSVYRWASAIRNFACSLKLKGHRLVALGHSAGAGTMMLSTLGLPLNEIPYAAVVLIEATMITREHFHASIKDRMETMEFTVNATKKRRDTWPSKEFAFEWMIKRFPWSNWDERVVRIMAEYGLKEVSSGEVKLKCPKEQEAVLYSDADGHFDAMDELARVSRALPVHAIWGETEDIVVGDIRDAMGDNTKGRFLASVTTVPDCGHWIVQENPTGLADALSRVLDSVPTSNRSRL